MPRAKPLFLTWLRCAGVLMSLLGTSPVWAHEGHDHEAENEARTVAAPDALRLVHSSAVVESVALIDARGLSVWVDDYASNRALAGLDVSARIGQRLIRASESEPGLYRVPRDLLGAGAGTIKLSIELSGKVGDVAIKESFGGELPLPEPAYESAAGSMLVWIAAGLLSAALIVALLLWVWRRRRVGAR